MFEPLIGEVKVVFKELGKGLVPLAESPDGLIEAVKMVGKRFVCAVQWHPEYMFKADADSLMVFSWFVGQCE